jgi:hypothetical protein
MSKPATAFRARLSAVCLGISGVFFVLYPALRPFSDEASLQGAAAFGSPQWLLAHMLAMVAFTLLPVGLLSLHRSLEGSASERAGYWAFVLMMVGVGLTLPFYGGEAYGLHAIGQAAVSQGNAALLDLAAVVRGGPGLIMFLVGLLTLAAAAIVAAAAIWKSGLYAKWSGIPFALGMALYIPQFFASQPLRVAHGVVVAAGCLWIAADLWGESRREAATARLQTPSRTAEQTSR